MHNRMLEKIERGEAIDLSRNEREGDDIVLDRVVDGMDYCLFDTEDWIWSIGRRKSDGVILASTSAKFYQNPDYECLWLR